MCSTDWGLWGHSCPITPWFINLLEPACMEILLLLSCVGCYLQPARQAVCISGCASLGCVLCNEMAHLVMYLAFSPVAEACFCIYLAFFLSTRIHLLTWEMKGWLGIPVDVCFINLHHCHFSVSVFSLLHMLVDLLFTVFIMFLTSSLSLPLLVHHVQFQMETRYSQIQKKKILRLISNHREF